MFFKGWGRQLAMFHLEAAAYDVRPGATCPLLLPPQNAHNLPLGLPPLNISCQTVTWQSLHPPGSSFHIGFCNEV